MGVRHVVRVQRMRILVQVHPVHVLHVRRVHIIRQQAIRHVHLALLDHTVQVVRISRHVWHRTHLRLKVQMILMIAI